MATNYCSPTLVHADQPISTTIDKTHAMGRVWEGQLMNDMKAQIKVGNHSFWCDGGSWLVWLQQKT